MKLSTRLERDFNAGVRKRGWDYYRQGLVRIQHGCEHDVEAHVVGSQTYGVSLAWTEPDLSVGCDCPYYDTDGPCKHIWATVLAAEARGYLSAAANASEVFLDEAVDEELDGEEEFQLLPPPPAKPPEPAPWRKHVESIATNGARDARFNEAWPAKRQVVYEVDVAASINARNLVFTPGLRDRKLDGSYSRIGSLNLKRSQVPQLPLAEDREILSALAGGAQYYGWAESGDYHQLPTSNLLEPPLASMIMPLAVGTGRCFLKQNQLTQNQQPGPLTPLSWDDGDPWRFELEMKPRDQGGWAVNGVLLRRDERLEVTVPVLITKGLVFTGERVAPLAEDAPLEWISHLRKEGCLEAPQEDGEQLLAELLRSPQLPALAVPEELRYQEVAVQPRLSCGLGPRTPPRPARESCARNCRLNTTEGLCRRESRAAVCMRLTLAGFCVAIRRPRRRLRSCLGKWASGSKAGTTGESNRVGSWLPVNCRALCGRW